MFCIASTVEDGSVFSPNNGLGGGLNDREDWSMVKSECTGVPDRDEFLSGGLVKTSRVGTALLDFERVLCKPVSID